MTLNDTILKGKKHIHFIGIGGSGMFPIVQILHANGFYITGSDNNESDILNMVRNLGIPVYMGQRAENIEGADLIVHTAAIMSDNPELIAAKESGVDLLERSVMLGIITKCYPKAVCVSGTHGKTTTSAMISHILLGAGLDPSCVVGGKVKSMNGYGRSGKSDIMVCEACEFVDTFLKLSPDISIILNIDADHLDYFKTVDNIIKSFSKFCDLTSDTIVVNGDDANSMKAVEGQNKKIITFGFGDTNDYYATNIVKHNGMKTIFDLMRGSEKLTTITLHVPGRHNIINAVAASVGALLCGATPQQITEHLETFVGAGRRFERLGEVGGVTIVDDYAHHPAELKVTLEAAVSMGFNKVWAVFQPFTYSRTVQHLDDFAKTLSIADRVVLTEIMGSREKNTYGIYSKDLAEKIDGCVWFDSFEEIAQYVLDNATPGDLVITLGCGDVYKIAKMMLK